MPTIKDERLKLWSEIGDAMSAGDFEHALLRMDVFAANFQDVKNKKGESAFEKWTNFKKTTDAKATTSKKAVRSALQNQSLNPLQRWEAEGFEIGNINNWATREKYYFLYRLAAEHNMFPSGIIDVRPRAREISKGLGESPLGE